MGTAELLDVFGFIHGISYFAGYYVCCDVSKCQVCVCMPGVCVWGGGGGYI